jgi:RNA polymerase sigma factor (sigma-70 family)
VRCDGAVTDPELVRTIEAVFHRESPRLMAGLMRLVRDVGLAEQLAQDAFVCAVEQWPVAGLPDHAGAWLMAVAKRRAIDQQRRGEVERLHEPAIAAGIEARAAERDPAVIAEHEVGDDLLRLVFLCCHPALPPEARTALTLRLVAGLTTAEIARAYLLPEPTIAQRIVRAKRTLAELGTPFEVPGAEQRAARLGSVLEVVYLVFNEGYAGTGGGEWLRRDLGEEALRLARVLAGLAPDEPEVHGLQALLELQASRFGARVDAAGAPILLGDQDRTRWDRVLIARGLDALARARALGQPAGPYQLQATIAACHARAPSVAATDWPLIVRLYGELLRLAPSPVVELNRAIAVGMAFGAAAGLHLVDELADAPELAQYHLLPAARGELLQQLGRAGEAAAEFDRAAAAAGNERERALLRQRAEACRALG